MAARSPGDWAADAATAAPDHVISAGHPPDDRDGPDASIATADLLSAITEELSDLMSAAAEDASREWRSRYPLDLGELVITSQPAGRRGAAWRPFLHQITKL